MSKKHEYKVGDKVRVRDWEDLLLESGMDRPDKDGCLTQSDGLRFFSNMRRYCGKVGTIIDTRDSWGDVRFRLDLGERTWWYSPMFVHLVKAASETKNDEKTKPTCDQSERIEALEAEIKKLKEQVNGEDPMGPTADKTKAKVLKPILPRVFRHTCGAMSVFQKSEHIVPPFIEDWTEGNVLNWHHWSGGSKWPVPPETRVVVYQRDGLMRAGHASVFAWHHDPPGDMCRSGDIVAYAVVEPPKLEWT